MNGHLPPASGGKLQRGLAAEGVTTNQPITINLTQPIRVSSALNLILDPLQLKYQIENEVVRITGKSATDEDVYPKSYFVADLVVPVPKTVRLDERKRAAPEKTVPDFDSLIKLIQSTIAPETWDKVNTTRTTSKPGCHHEAHTVKLTHVLPSMTSNLGDSRFATKTKTAKRTLSIL